jgi:hypothetical protein
MEADCSASMVLQTAPPATQSQELPVVEIRAFMDETRNFMDEMQAWMRNMDTRRAA